MSGNHTAKETPLTLAPRFTDHARQRCKEMGVDLQVVSQIVCRPDTLTTSVVPAHRVHGTVCMAYADAHPDYAVFYKPGPVNKVITVVFRTEVEYVREGKTFRPKDQDDEGMRRVPGEPAPQR